MTLEHMTHDTRRGAAIMRHRKDAGGYVVSFRWRFFVFGNI
jgi:hypothetical protein